MMRLERLRADHAHALLAFERENQGTAELGYRIGERAAGRGTATAAVEAVTRLAVEAYGLDALTATATLDNPASMAVLRRNGFTDVEDLDIDGRPAVRFRRQLVQPESQSGSP